MAGKYSYERFRHQVLLKGFGPAAQQALRDAAVLVVGAGGLGCPALQYLAAAGVGRIGIIDPDTVSLSNLHRQILYSLSDLDRPKVSAAAARLREFYPELEVVTYQQPLRAREALELFPQYDIILDGTDNFSSRYLISDGCQLLGKRLISGAVSGFEGQLFVFDSHQHSAGNRPLSYRDVFARPPAAGTVPDCNEAGVLGVLTGVIGTMMASEAIRLLTGLGDQGAGFMLQYQLLRQQTFHTALVASAAADAWLLSSAAAYLQRDYGQEACGAGTAALEWDVPVLERARKEQQLLVVDIREPGELPQATGLADLRLSEAQLLRILPTLSFQQLLLCCNSGTRSRAAAGRLRAAGYPEVYSLKGGIRDWLARRDRAAII
ncbi:hypothetical protein GCM10027051_06190 [Niabella terrae]